MMLSGMQSQQNVMPVHQVGAELFPLLSLPGGPFDLCGEVGDSTQMWGYYQSFPILLLRHVASYLVTINIASVLGLLAQACCSWLQFAPIFTKCSLFVAHRLFNYLIIRMKWMGVDTAVTQGVLALPSLHNSMPYCACYHPQLDWCAKLLWNCILETIQSPTPEYFQVPKYYVASYLEVRGYAMFSTKREKAAVAISAMAFRLQPARR